jgi:membrane protein involved in colicin uptake
MCFNFLLVYPADGVPNMCMDIGKISQEEDSAKRGICIDASDQNGLAEVFRNAGMGGAARGQGSQGQRPAAAAAAAAAAAGSGIANLDAYAGMTMVFAKPPKNVSAYVDPVCARRAAVKEAEEEAGVIDASSRRLGGAPALCLTAVCVAAVLSSGFPLSFA